MEYEKSRFIFIIIASFYVQGINDLAVPFITIFLK